MKEEKEDAVRILVENGARIFYNGENIEMGPDCKRGHTGEYEYSE